MFDLEGVDKDVLAGAFFDALESLNKSIDWNEKELAAIKAGRLRIAEQGADKRWAAVEANETLEGRKERLLAQKRAWRAKRRRCEHDKA